MMRESRVAQKASLLTCAFCEHDTNRMLHDLGEAQLSWESKAGEITAEVAEGLHFATTGAFLSRV